MSDPVVADTEPLCIHLLSGYHEEQFSVNDSEESVKLWQVFDRTENREVARNSWVFEAETGNVVVTGALPCHEYTVNFLAFRIWEEINMYNHVTNSWTSEHQRREDGASHPDRSKERNGTGISS